MDAFDEESNLKLLYKETKFFFFFLKCRDQSFVLRMGTKKSVFFIIIIFIELNLATGVSLF